ncbi:MAG TPA: DPP IV N-terminal domain-containing protein [Anaerolineales bacterium]|nr:DPP IV N-terminal domain-containing protein [Anaerolineales bacterium]
MRKTICLIRIASLLVWLLAACQPAVEPALPSPTALPSQPTPTLPPSPTFTLPPAPTDMPQPTAMPAPNPAGVVVFYSERDGDAEIYLMNPDGTDQHPLTDNDADDTSPTWSPDGSLIAFESDRDDPHPHTCFPRCDYNLYLMNADGSQPHRLTSLPGAEWHAAWSPDGRSLVFTAGDLGYTTMGIYTLSLDEGEPQPLLVDEFENDAADWSPDGTQMAFSSNREGSRDIFVMDADGSGMRKVVDTGLDDYFPEWSPDGSQLAFFAANFPSTRQDIFTVDLDGGNLANLTNTPGVVDEDPQWSPDGSQIIFQSDRDQNFEIYVMNADGSQPQNLTDHGGRDYWPEWWAPTAGGSVSTPGSRIAFVSTRDGNGEIYTTNLDGSDPQRLTHWSQWDGFPDWSPDGSQIAYYSYLSSQHWAIMIMNADGSEPRQLTPGDSCDGAPHWSPDGAFITYDSGSCTGDLRDIFLIPVAGGDPRNLTNHPADDMLGAWSPDGAQLAFTSDRDGNYEIYLMNADGSNVRRLTDDPAEDHAPAWSPDGTQIAFYSESDGNAEIYIMNADGSNPVRLTEHPGDDWFPHWSPDGSQITFSAWRDGGLEIYVMNADGSNVRRLTDSPGENFNSAWQP